MEFSEVHILGGSVNKPKNSLLAERYKTFMHLVSC